MARGAVDWAAIETPSGRATKVPSHLESLSSGDAKTRAKSLAALRRLAVYEGDVTLAAVPLAPHLVGIARAAESPELAGVLRLLADLLVCGNADLWIVIGYDVRTPAFESAEPEQYGRALYEAIVLQRHYWHHTPPGDDTIGGAWAIADLAPTPAVAEAIVKEIVSWSGSNAPYPEAFAIDLLRGMGDAARPAIDAALATSPKYADVLRRVFG